MDFVSLDSTHVMTVSRGPLLEALPTYITQAGWDHLMSTSCVEEEGNEALAEPLVESQLKSMQEQQPQQCQGTL